MKFFLEILIKTRYLFRSTIIIFSSDGLGKRGGGIATRRKSCQPFLTRNSFNPRRSPSAGTGSQIEKEIEGGEISFELRFETRRRNLFAGEGRRIAYADRCAHLRSSFFGAVSSVHEMLDFCFDFRVLGNLSMGSLELCQVLAGMKVSLEMFTRNWMKFGKEGSVEGYFCLESL